MPWTSNDTSLMQGSIGMRGVRARRIDRLRIRTSGIVPGLRQAEVGRLYSESWRIWGELILREEVATPSFLIRGVAPEGVNRPHQRLRGAFPWQRAVDERMRSAGSAAGRRGR